MRISTHVLFFVVTLVFMAEAIAYGVYANVLLYSPTEKTALLKYVILSVPLINLILYVPCLH